VPQDLNLKALSIPRFLQIRTIAAVSNHYYDFLIFIWQAMSAQNQLLPWERQPIMLFSSDWQ
jgi:hypothetical protein